MPPRWAFCAFHVLSCSANRLGSEVTNQVRLPNLRRALLLGFCSNIVRVLRRGCIFAFLVLAGSLHAQQISPPKYSGATIHEEWIPLHDGIRLAVNLFMPKGANPGDKFPAILEYLPYRKDDWSAQRD